MATFAEEFADLLPDKIIVASVGTRNAYDETTPGDSVTYDGRVVYKTTVRRRGATTEFSSPFHAIIDCQTLIPLDSLITLPDGSVRKVRDSELARDENNLPHHATVYFEG